MRQKRDPLVVRFNPPSMTPITLPRSLTHESRGPSMGDLGPGPRFVGNPGQMGRPGEPGRPLAPGTRPPGPAQQVQYHQQPPFSQAGPSHLQGGPPHPQHSQAPLPPGMQAGSPYPSGLPQQHPLQPYQQIPQASSSSQSSPHLTHMAPPFRNQAGGPPMTLQQRQNHEAQSHNAMVYQQAMQVIGLAGRDPESLNMDEQNAVQAHIRKTSGGLPPTPQSQFRPPPQRMASQQRMHPDAMQPGTRLPPGQPQYPPGMQPPPVPRQDPNQLMHHQQQQQQQHQLQREHINQTSRQPQQPPPGMPMHAQLQYASSQAGSPASPLYSGSPYNPPLQLQQHSGQGSPPPSFAAPSNRGAYKPRGGGSTASLKMSPANSKRAGSSLEDPSPRSRKRTKGGSKDDDGMAVPETPRFDISGPPSPGTGPMQGAPPYPAARSPLPQDVSSRGAFDALQTANARMAQQQGNSPHDLSNGDGNVHGPGSGNGNGNGYPTNGAANGSISRPGSSASNYLIPTNNFSSDTKHSPAATSPHPMTAPSEGGFADVAPSAMHISIPSPLPPSSFQLNTGTDMTPGGSRPFAGHPQVSTPLPMTNGGPPAPTPDAASYQYTGNDDDFLNADLSGLDFAFSTFIDDSIFKEDPLSEVTLS
ncbi:hypothetical protein P7C70_g730, partial [Phenoliferia sp. Uapishka_3]